jgi:hypothetical protein
VRQVLFWARTAGPAGFQLATTGDLPRITLAIQNPPTMVFHNVSHSQRAVDRILRLWLKTTQAFPMSSGRFCPPDAFDPSEHLRTLSICPFKC